MYRLVDATLASGSTSTKLALFSESVIVFSVEMLPMATKKKVKTKAKKRKRSPARKAVSRKKVVLKKAVAKKQIKTKKKAKATAKASAAPAKVRAAARKPTPKSKPAAPAAPPDMERIGIITHYYSHLKVATIELTTGRLREGETIHIKGHTTDFSQPVESMEVNHVHVTEAHPGESFGLRVKEHAREHDVVYRPKQ